MPGLVAVRSGRASLITPGGVVLEFGPEIRWRSAGRQPRTLSALIGASAPLDVRAKRLLDRMPSQAVRFRWAPLARPSRAFAATC